MSVLDSQQVSLRLTKVPYIRAELRKKRRIVRDADNEEVFQIQFNSQTFNFKEDHIITVGKTVADCLISDAFVICGAPIDGPVEPVLEVVREFSLSEGETAAPPTTCLFCKEDQGTVADLIDHLRTEHSDDEPPAEAASERSHTPARTAKAKSAKASVSVPVEDGGKNADSN